MQTGKGFHCPSCEIDMRMFGFRCPSCNLYLVNKVLGTSTFALECPRCKAYTTVSIKVYNGEVYNGNGGETGLEIKIVDQHSFTMECKRCKSQVSVRLIEKLPWVRTETAQEIMEEEKKAENRI